ncbi:MAG: tyrosine-type recombinase/integrase [Dehalococcoidales bacterium]
MRIVRGKAPKLDTLIDRYRLSNTADGKSPKTIEWYDAMLRAYSRYAEQTFGNNSLNHLKRDDVRSYILYLREKTRFQNHPHNHSDNQPLSSRTIQGHIRTLKAFSTWVFDEGYTSENVLRDMKLPKAAATIIEPLSKEEIARIFSSIDVKTSIGMRDHTILAIFLDTGLRASELANIRMDHISLETGLIKVMGKGSRERIVPIGKFVQLTLLEYIKRIRPGLGQTDTDHLFLSSGGRPLSVNTVKLLFQRLKKSTGISKLHAHLCRHTFAINYLMNGGDIFSLKEILGHRSLDMVNHYLHFTSHQIAIQHHKFSPMDRLRDSLSTTHQ